MSADAGRARPAAVTLIGWVWILLSGFWILSSLVGLAALRALDQISINFRQQGPSDLLGALEEAAWMAEHVRLILALEIAVAAVILFVAVSFLRRRPWARAALLAVGYGCLAVLLLGSGWWWSRIPSVAGGAGVPGAVETLARVVILFVVLFCGVPIGCMLALLHGKRLRRGFEIGPPPEPLPPPPPA